VWFPWAALQPINDKPNSRRSRGNVMKTITRIAAIFALMFLAGFANVALAQRPYRLSEGDLKGLINRLERDSDQFRKSLDSSLDRSRLDGSRAEDRINDFVKDFEVST